MSPELDHLVLGCLSLDEARPRLEAALGVPAQGGGAHVGRGTHNALWGLDAGPGGPAYLELIAPDPDQPAPADGTLPFGLHLPQTRARLADGPALIAWVARCRDLDAWAARSPVALGPPMDMRRGDLTWRLTVTETGAPNREGRVPSLIEWARDVTPPGAAMAGSGLRLVSFVRRADPEAAAALAALELDGVLAEGETGDAPMRAEIEGPGGTLALG